ncbi:hypothetical protein X798_00826 [Onchocerca flexuosa]|uniref:EGF-like domain-containing protein n=1 Tax=Onchocerca flexuosa TaxID=387005 RepID=A0A238C4K2_9BILA|nr:hypothetical protein X798_00826 [Onchocerca flexuosa]
MCQKFLILFVIKYFYQILAEPTKRTNEAIHFCDPSIPNDCGFEGKCIRQLNGNRCRCPIGRMGIMCRRKWNLKFEKNSKKILHIRNLK